MNCITTVKSDSSMNRNGNSVTFGSLVKTRKQSVSGTYPPCHIIARLEERNAQRSAQYSATNFTTYDIKNRVETPETRHDFLNTSFNLCDYLRSRENGLNDQRGIDYDYTRRHLIVNEVLHETEIKLGSVDKVLCSKWLSNRQVVFGTNCNKLLVYDVNKRRVDEIPTLGKIGCNMEAMPRGLNAIQINKSHCFLATGATNLGDLGVYRLPTCEPLCLGKGAHRFPIMDMCWIDDVTLITASLEARLCLWRIPDGIADSAGEREPQDSFPKISARIVKDLAPQIRIKSICFNEDWKEIAAVSFTGFFLLFDAESFQHKYSHRLPARQINSSITYHSIIQQYVLCSRNYISFLDPRTYQSNIMVSSRCTDCGICSLSCKNDLIAFSTVHGLLMFYDIRAGKTLGRRSDPTRNVSLKCSRGTMYPIDGPANYYLHNYKPAIYTHCFDPSGLRLFAAGGPLPTEVKGSYAGLFQ